MDDEKIEQKPQEEKYDRSPGHIRQLHAKGNTYEEIAERLGTTGQNIRNIVYRDNLKKKEAEANKRPRGRPKGSKNKTTLAKEKMLTNWEQSPVASRMRDDKAELNTAAGWFVGECWKLGQSVDTNDVDSLYNALGQYVLLCAKSGMPMLVKTCHLALGLTGGQATQWRTGSRKANDPRFKEFVQVMDSVIAAGIEASGANGSLDRVLTIWFEKAHFGLYEQQGLRVENADPLGEKKTAKEIVAQYSDILPNDN